MELNFKNIYLSTILFIIIIVLGLFIKFDFLYISLLYKTFLSVLFLVLLKSLKIIKTEDIDF